MIWMWNDGVDGRCWGVCFLVFYTWRGLGSEDILGVDMRFAFFRHGVVGMNRWW